MTKEERKKCDEWVAQQLSQLRNEIHDLWIEVRAKPKARPTSETMKDIAAFCICKSWIPASGAALWWFIWSWHKVLTLPEKLIPNFAAAGTGLSVLAFGVTVIIGIVELCFWAKGRRDASH